MPESKVDIASWAVLVVVFAISVALLAAAGISIAAFCQNRDMSLWPPKIGPRPIDTSRGKDLASLNSTSAVAPAPALVPSDPATSQMSGASGVVRPYQYRSIRMPARDRLFDREFSVDQALEFYQNIAPYYDQRNSGKLIRTHRQTTFLIKRLQEQRPTLRVLDLGSGTGVHVASSFMNDPSISWDYVDFSSAMYKEFQSHFAGTILSQSSSAHLNDIGVAISSLEHASYDVIILSLVLSSMPSVPDFEKLARLVAPGGAVIISDIDPGYAALHPHYAVEVNGTRYALKLNPVNPFQLITKANDVGFRSPALYSIADNEAAQQYSFIAVFMSSEA